MCKASEDISTLVERVLAGPENPDREFVCSGATFGEVYAMAARLGEVLARSEQSGSGYCLATDNKALMAAAILVSLAGGPSFLLPYTLSVKALIRMQATTGFKVAVSQEPRELPNGVALITPASFLEMGYTEGEGTPKDELLKIYTGGSTGTPQVWRKTAENLFGEAFFLAKTFEVSRRDCILATVPPNHIYGLLYSVILPLVSHASVVEETPSFPGEIIHMAQKHGVTVLASVPAHYRVLRNSSLDLRLAFSSAGMLDREDNEAFCTKNEMGITEVYGSTETGGIAIRNRWSGEEFFTPFASISWKILNQCLAVCSPYISPDLPIDGDGYFTANDRVEKKAENSFTLLGRADNVTKVGGKRVDLEEIRVLVKRERGVSDCAVMVRPQAGGREHRIEVLVQGAAIDLESLKRSLGTSLEPYAQPRVMKSVDQIPVKSNGKYDWLAIAEILAK